MLAAAYSECWVIWYSWMCTCDEAPEDTTAVEIA
jgi:hypothetical protein